MRITTSIRNALVNIVRARDFRKLRGYHGNQEHEFYSVRAEILSGKIELESPQRVLIHSTWDDFARRIKIDFLDNPQIDFFGVPVFVSSMTGLHLFHKNEQLLERVEKYFGREKCQSLLEEDLVGVPVFLRNCRYRTSLNRLVHGYQLVLANEGRRHLEEAAFSITEWGGGFGGLARLFVRMYPNCTYNIIDIPEVSLVQYIYLRSILGPDKVVLHNGSLPIKSGAVNLVPNSYLATYIKALTCDTFISSWALSESTDEAQRLVMGEKFFGARDVLLIYQPASERHPFSENLVGYCESTFPVVRQAAFPYWLDQTVLQATAG